MQYIYFGTIFAAAIIFFLIGLLLFLQRKRGERSRAILAGMTLLSVLNYIGMIVYFYIDPTYSSYSILSVPFLLIGIFVITIYVMYPIEVISPGWLNRKRLLKIYIPVVVLFLFYRLTLWLGVDYPSYQTLGMMMDDIWSFQVIFRIVLAVLIFIPVVLLYYIPYTRRYNNTNHKWIRRYNAAIMINMAAYLFVNTHDTFLVCSLYVAVSVLCSLYIAYQELYVRLIRNPIDLKTTDDNMSKLPDNTESTVNTEPNIIVGIDSRRVLLFDKLEEYMNKTQAWRDPDLSVVKLSRELHTNRTSLLKAIQQSGCDSYTTYVNGKRIENFIQITKQHNGVGFSYLQTFFDVGFRSKSSALRNFKEITGTIPSDYFKKRDK